MQNQKKGGDSGAKPAAGIADDCIARPSSASADRAFAAQRIHRALQAWSERDAEADGADSDVAPGAAKQVQRTPIDDDRKKAVNLPAIGKITIAMPHILSGHWAGNRNAVAGGDRNMAGRKDVFPPTMDPAAIEATIRAAYAVCSKVQTQGDRVKLVGVANGLTLEMWLNLTTKTLESAYPKGR